MRARSLEFERDGVVFLPQFLSSVDASRFKWIAETCFDVFARNAAPEGTDHYAYLCRSYEGWTGLQMGHLLGYFKEKMPYHAHILETALQGVMLIGGELQLEDCFFRQVLPTKGGVAWHCDAEAASMMRFGKEARTVWMPLQPVGETLPSLEFILGSHNIMRARTDLNLSQHRSDNWISTLTEARYIPKVTNLGDAVLFDQYTLHHTQSLWSDTPRYNCEFRFTASP